MVGAGGKRHGGEPPETDGARGGRARAGARYVDTGLYLYKAASGSASWVFRWKDGNRRRELGLGSFSAVTLAEPRKRAAEARAKVAAGENAIAERRKAVAPHTFAEVAEACIEAKRPAWKSEKQAQMWRQPFRDFCKPIARKPVADITAADVEAVLAPIWPRVNEIARRHRGRIEAVLD